MNELARRRQLQHCALEFQLGCLLLRGRSDALHQKHMYNLRYHCKKRKGNYMREQTTAARGKYERYHIAIFRTYKNSENCSNFVSNGWCGCLEAGMKRVHQPNLLILRCSMAILNQGEQKPEAYAAGCNGCDFQSLLELEPTNACTTPKLPGEL